VVAEAEQKNEKLILLIGRPYNMYDAGANLGLPQKIADLGRTVLPMDFLKPELSRLGERYRNAFWSYGQKILATLELAASSDIMDVVYLTNFSCGPDSFLLSYAEEIMGNRPILMLELDEHGADAGYMTRLEAFFDVLRRPRPARTPRIPVRQPIVQFIDETADPAGPPPWMFHVVQGTAQQALQVATRLNLKPLVDW